MVKLGDSINLIHRRVGIATVIVFLATGVYLEVRFPDLYGSNEAIRYLQSRLHTALWPLEHWNRNVPRMAHTEMEKELASHRIRPSLVGPDSVDRRLLLRTPVRIA